VRTDLKLGKGKLCAQVAHASLSSFLETQKTRLEWAEKWLKEGQKKVVVKVESLNDLMQIKRKCEVENLPHALIQDKGLTQIPPGTITCLGIGPAPEELIDKITGKLKLL